MSDSKLHRKVLAYFLVVLLAVFFCALLMPGFIRFFMPFVIGWLIAMIANPLVRFMEERIKIVRKHGSVIIIVLVLGSIVGLLYLAASFLIHETMELILDLPDLYETFKGQMEKASVSLGNLYHVLPDGIKTIFNYLKNNIGTYITKALSGVNTPTIRDAGLFAKNAADFLFMSVITIMSAYFFIAKKETITKRVRDQIPRSILEQYDMINESFRKAVGGYFKAQFKIMFVVMAILFGGFILLHVKYSFLLALGTAFLDLLPVFGTGAVLWPWAVMEAAAGNYGKVAGLLVIYLVCLIVKQILQPKIVGDSIGASPFQTLVFMFIGYKIGGVFGLIIGVPAGMILINLYRNGLFNRLIKGMKLLIHDVAEYIRF